MHRETGPQDRRESGGAHPPRSREEGFSLIEIIMAITVIVIALLTLASVVVTTSNLQRSTRETTVAYNASRAVVERFQQEDFAVLYRNYNSDPADDPGGSGTSPGATFDVPGLNSVGAARVGRIVFPEGKDFSGVLVLQEDVDDAALGMPGGRDLNGDGAIDDLSHNLDYLILPVRIELHWRGVSGERRLSLNAFIAEK